ncbi:MAG TPA: AbrB/MazE/SpoVT family DNA-binding domain-containing protein [Fervidicoccus fontis]|uniref:AbrB/MazE/SpoVT family DNA-binding domain-containing protein n=1 Tax=Fervidicoccus fontis TaxID=683846 RepID=A0A7C2ULJ4_9CREN|nr:AbrB/MazE/SpoVT family DNA-binding domain-containing protein [Fervidicoccus fontis]
MRTLLIEARKKGVLILPKVLRESVGVEEGDVLVAEVKDGAIVLRPLKPKVVEIDRRMVEEILEEEKKVEDRKIEEEL